MSGIRFEELRDLCKQYLLNHGRDFEERTLAFLRGIPSDLNDGFGKEISNLLGTSPSFSIASSLTVVLMAKNGITPEKSRPFLEIFRRYFDTHPRLLQLVGDESLNTNAVIKPKGSLCFQLSIPIKEYAAMTKLLKSMFSDELEFLSRMGECLSAITNASFRKVILNGNTRNSIATVTFSRNKNIGPQNDWQC